MSTYISVSALTQRISDEYHSPYPQAVLNAIHFETSMSGNIVAASVNRPSRFTNAYYKKGWITEQNLPNGYPYGLPEIELNNGYIVDLVHVKAYLESHYQNAGIATILSAKVITGEELSSYDVARSHFTHTDPLNPIGLIDEPTLSESAGGTHRVEYLVTQNPPPPPPNPTPPNYQTPKVTIYRQPSRIVNVDGNIAIQDDNYPDPPHYTKLTITDGNESFNTNPTYLNYRYSKGPAYVSKDWVTDDNGNSSLEKVEHYSLAEVNVGTFILKPQSTDLLYLIEWSTSGYPNEKIVTILNMNTTDYSSVGLMYPVRPDLGYAYPIVQIRKDKKWLEEYEPAVRVKQIERTFKKLRVGSLKKFIQRINESGSLDDITDMYITLGVSAYTRNRDDNKYLMLFWQYVVDNTVGVLKTSNALDDINFISITEGRYNQYLSFRNVEIVENSPLDLMDKKIEYTHTWIQTLADAEVTPPWMVSVVYNEESGMTQLVEVPPENDADSKRNKRIDKLNGYSLLLEAKDENGVLIKSITVHGLQQNHEIRLPNSANSRWAEDLPNAEKEQWYWDKYDAEHLPTVYDASGNKVDPPPYEGPQSTPFTVPLLRTLIMDKTKFRGLERENITGSSIFLQIYGAKVVHVAWWKEVLSFVLEAFSFFRVFFMIVTLGTFLFVELSMQAFITLAYKIGLDFLKGAIIKMLVKSIGKTNTLIAQLLFAAVTGHFDDITKFDATGLQQLQELTMSVIEIKMTAKIEELQKIDTETTVDTDTPKKDDIDSAIDEVFDSVLFESSKEFIDRTTAVDIVEKTLSVTDTKVTSPKDMFSYADTKYGKSEVEKYAKLASTALVQNVVEEINTNFKDEDEDNEFFKQFNE